MTNKMLHNVRKTDESGFTLIELSIVLVLVGLIIGGVLKGQELIASTRLKMTVSQWDAVKAAVNTFQDKYVSLPGDYDQASTYIKAGLDDGDADGMIGEDLGTNDYDDQLRNTAGVNENQAAWIHLYESGLLASVDTNNSVLPAKVSGAAFYLAYGTFGENTASQRTAHWLRLQSGNGVGALNADPLTAFEAAEIDRKYDDGDFGTGSIQAGVAGAGTCSDTAPTTTKSCTAYMEVL